MRRLYSRRSSIKVNAKLAYLQVGVVSNELTPEDLQTQVIKECVFVEKGSNEGDLHGHKVFLVHVSLIDLDELGVVVE